MEIRDLIRAAEDAGCKVRRTRRNHFVFLGPDGRRLATTSGTPSDWRSMKNCVAALRRAGVEIPRK